MGEEERNPVYKKDNLRILRHHLGLTQRELIERYLSDENGKASISIATYSNLESKGGARLDDTILGLSGKLALDPMIFTMAPDKFGEQMELFLPEKKEMESTEQGSDRRSGFDHLLNRMTMYFAEQVLDGRLKKGDQIESDRVLAAKLGAGRSAIREALKVLGVMGMIDIRPGQGSFISSREENFFIIPLAWAMFLNGEQVDNILTVRNLLEVKAAQLAADCQDEEKLLRLHDSSHRLLSTYMQCDYREFLEEDVKFHLCIAECSGNPVIYGMIQTIRNLLQHVSGTGMADETQLREINEEHQRIYGLLIARDGEGAAQAMQRHLENALKRYRFQ